MDMHLDWCGPCVCMEINYTSLWFNIDSPEKRIKFCQISDIHLPDDLKERLKLDVVPRFLVYLGGTCVREIKGAKFVDLQNAIEENLPEMDE